ncbi:MAG TPA: flagellar hook-basal body complex protein FliE [Acidimicrobiales bacterium]|nr:flagellar hook-basal body complex protein FliE [Acidimicrobiales bacterium]
MTVVPVAPVVPLGGVTPAAAAPAAGSTQGGFGNILGDALQNVSDSERFADEMVGKLAAGEDVQVHDVLAATTKARLTVDLLVAVRDQAVQAYQQISNLQL